jgi:hypothetical protein
MRGRDGEKKATARLMVTRTPTARRPLPTTPPPPSNPAINSIPTTSARETVLVLPVLELTGFVVVVMKAVVCSLKGVVLYGGWVVL